MLSSLGRLAAASAVFSALSIAAHAQTTLGCSTGGGGGPIPTAGTGDGAFPTTLPSAPLVSVLNVATLPAGATGITELQLHGLTHTFTSDLQFVLDDPAGGRHNILCRIGGACDYNGDYTVFESGAPGGACGAIDLPPGSYNQAFGGYTNGANSIFNTVLGAIPIATGNWTLTVYDWAAADVGNLTSWDLCFGTPPPPPPPPPVCAELPTIFAGGNFGSAGGQVFFNMTVINPAGIMLGELAINTAQVGAFTIDMYTRPTTWVGFNGSVAGWTLLTSGPGTGVAVGQPSYADVADVLIPPGTYGVALVLSLTHAFTYTNGTGANQAYANADVSLAAGAAQNAPWNNLLFTPRVWNGIIRYNCVGPAPVAYCTAGTSTNGCVPSMSADNNPSVAQSNPCNISIANVEGQKFGIVFYGIDQTGFSPSPWAVGSTSFLCVKGPTQRTGTSNSGGTLNACDGTLTLDWNAYQTANPSSVGNPWAVGDKVYVQGWYRDPPAPKTTNLSDALEMTYVP